MTGWSVMLRGIRHRSGRSLVVLLLAAVATMAAVLAPAYGRAAAQSVLTDGLLSASPSAVALSIGAEGSANSSAAAHQPVGDSQAQVDAALRGAPKLAAVLDRPVGSVDTDAVLAGGAEEFAARLAWRMGVCGQVRVTGDCAIDAEQAMLSTRSAAQAGIEVGDTITVRGTAGDATRRLEVVGLYTPVDASAGYWGNHGYFAHGGQSGEVSAFRLDAVFTGSEDDVRLSDSTLLTQRLAYPLRPQELRLDDIAALRDELGTLSLNLSGSEFTLETALLSILDAAASDQRALERTVPIIAVPLVLLAWLVLFLLIAALTEERAPQLALARLRGFPAGASTRFGIGETLLLIALGAPLGLLAGLGLVELAARTVLADGARVELRWPVFAAAGAGLVVACGGAWLAGRRTAAKGVLELLRRVPQRTTWRAGLLEGVVATLAVASVVAAWQDRSAPLALLAPAALAVAAGIAAGRLLRAWARLRLGIARRRGQVPSMLAAAQLARRPGSTRMVAVLTAAIALLAFAATAWDVAVRARTQHAEDALGAASVHVVAADHPQALVDAVAAADPSGRSMAVVRADEQYGDGKVELVGVQSALLSSVATWRGYDSADLAELAARLAGTPTQPVMIKDSLSVRLGVSGLGAARLRIGVLLSMPGQAPKPLWLGRLMTGTSDYSASAAECEAGCRFVGFVIGRMGAGSGEIAVQLDLEQATTAGSALAMQLSDGAAWQPLLERTPNAEIVITPSLSQDETFGISINSSDPGDVQISYLDTPRRLPAVLAGPAPTEGDSGEFTFPGFADLQQQFSIIEQSDRLPRVGAHGLLFDLDLAARAASTSVGLAEVGDLRYEVWSAADAPADLTAKLSAAGVQVLRTQTLAAETEQLGRRAPALGLRLYLLAGVAAALLALGLLMLSSRIGARERQTELSALRITGVRQATLRRALRGERLTMLGLPLLLGLLVGVATAALMLPGIPLVTVDSVGWAGSARTGGFGAALADLLPASAIEALPIAVASALATLLIAVARGGRLVRRSAPELNAGGGR